MRRKSNFKETAVLLPLTALLAFSFPAPEAEAVEDLLKTDPDTSVLVLYSTEDGEISPAQRLLDMALGHYTDNISFRSASEVTSDHVEEASHIFYYGESEEDLPSETTEILSSFEGGVVAIGHNVEELGDRFDFVGPEGEETVASLNIPSEQDKELEIEPNTIFAVETSAEAEVLVEASGDNGSYPLIAQSDDSYYVASDNLTYPYSVYFSQAMNEVFDRETEENTPAYLRLEDVHPLADAEQLMEIADVLKERNIPYMVAVIPAYTHPVTGREYNFNDSPDVLDALRYMQENGGSIVLHGYTHQFRETETGEGFEFWDVENDMPIYHGPFDEPKNKTEEHFSSEAAYETYMEENIAFETEYISERLTRGVQELSNFGLYPLAFEPPHYTMSQNGYQVTAEHFSTFVGHLQLSDEYWEAMDTTPYASRPSFLHGMTLLPETIGYVMPENENAVEDMGTLAEYYQITEGGLIGGFYHPYLGVAGLIEVVDMMEEVPDIEWIDLQEMDNRVEVENVTITSGDGTIEADIDTFGLMTTSLDYPVYHIRNFTETVTWAIAGLGITGVVMFIGYTVFGRPVKRLVERRGR